MNYLKITLLVALSIITSCKQENNKPEKENYSSVQLSNSISKYHNHKGYDKTAYPLGLFTREYFQQEATFAKELISEISTIEKNELSLQEQISVNLLQFVLENKIKSFDFEMFLNPLLTDAGFHTDLVYEVKSLTNYNQVKLYLNKLNAIPEYVNQHIVNLKEGVEKGISQPKIIFKGYETTYDMHIVANPEDSFYYTPFKNLPENISPTQKDSILQAAKQVIIEKVTPQFKRIKTFFEEEYLPKTRTTIGVSETPRGNLFYQNRIEYYTTLSLTAEEVYNKGVEEVARIKKEMEAIISEVNFKGDFAAFLQFLRTDSQFYAKTPKELLMLARDISKRADGQLPRFFKTLPRKPYGVAPVPDAIAPKYTSGRYIPTTPESTEPGYYWVNTYDLKSRPVYVLPALTAHEAMPGHHLQGSINNELEDDIPQFRKDLYLSAYGEGWGLYSEFLAEEMGLYTTPYEKFGKLTYEMWRACRLVVDTGIHAKGWTRDQAIDYMKSNTALSLHEVNTEIDRYIAWPGQALSYKVGELKIRSLREKAKKALKTKFDIREFHEIVLLNGTVTLSILEDNINRYIESKSHE